MILLSPFFAAVLLGMGTGAGAESVGEAGAGAFCRAASAADLTGPEYYQVELVATSSVPWLEGVTGYVDVNPARSVSTVSVSTDGSYLYDLEVHLDNLRPEVNSVYTAWLASHDLSEIRHLGTVEEGRPLRGQVSFNKFLVIITLEPKGQEVGEKWRGPIVTRGMSRSGLMHTMIGHGPLQEESCAVFGFR